MNNKRFEEELNFNNGIKTLNAYHDSGAFAGTVYHYTSPLGLKGIIESKSIYFTDCNYLNDMQERVSINEAYIMFWEEYSKLYEKSFTELLKNIYSKDIVPYNKYFVFSCSINSDNLSLWKYYSKNNKYEGYALGLFTAALDDVANYHIEHSNSFILFDGVVYYRIEDKIGLIKSAVDKLFDKWKENNRTKEIEDFVIHEMKEWFYHMAIFFKHEAYEEEQEYRFVIQIDPRELSILKSEKTDTNLISYFIRESKGMFIPTIKLKFIDSVDGEIYSPLDEIKFGPTYNNELIEKGIKELLEYNGFDIRDIRINSSDIPLRY